MNSKPKQIGIGDAARRGYFSEKPAAELVIILRDPQTGHEMRLTNFPPHELNLLVEYVTDELYKKQAR